MADKNTIVVGIDRSPASAAALAWAVRHAKRSGKSVLAVSVCQIHPVPPSSMPLPVAEPAGEAPFRALHQHELDVAIQALGPDAEGVRIEQSVPSGSPGRVLVEISAGADSLVLGGHGYRKSGIYVLSSVTSYCLRHAACPVVVVPMEAERHAGPLMVR